MSNHFSLILLAIFAFAAQANEAGGNPQPRDIKIQLTPVTQDLYRFKYHIHNGPVLVTPEGILIADPPSAAAARWLKDELKRRFDKPVRYMIYSHHHSDHIGGARVFADGSITVIAHELTKKHLAESPEKTRLPLPDITFRDEYTLKFGGKTIRLIHLDPPTHADDLITVLFEEDRTLHSIDVVSLGSTNFLMSWRDDLFPSNIETMKNLEKLDFDQLLTGHYPLGTKQGLTNARQYLEDLRAAVQKAIDDGLTLEEAVQTVEIEKYKTLGRYELFPANVASAYKALKGDPPPADALPPEKSKYLGTSRYIGDPLVTRMQCVPCHGQTGASPYRIFPHLAGQKADYMKKVFRAYAAQTRFDSNMSSMDLFSSRDLDDLADYYSRQPALAPSESLEMDARSVENAKRLSATCAACHGQNGISLSGQFPNLAGQHYQYLKGALTRYKTGEREEPSMAPFLISLSDQDIDDLAKYYAGLDPRAGSNADPTE